jgi:hypothetical protein
MVYQPQLYNGTLPGPVGNIAGTLSGLDIAVHRQRAVDLYQFLVRENKDLLELNMDSQCRTIIIGLPSSSKVRVLHSAGCGSSGIGAISQIDGKLLFLTGDGGNDIGTPVPMVLPSEAVEQHEAITMSPEQFVTNLTDKGQNFTWPLTKRTQAVANDKVSIMNLAPIPAFLVLDGFTKDICAAELYERVMSLDNHEGEMMSHLKQFLLACITGHNIGDFHPSISQEILFTPIPADARRWATKQFKATFPDLQPAPPAAGGLHPDILALIAQLIPQRQAQAANATQEEKKDDDTTVMNMSRQEYDITLQMCGLPANSTPETLPRWWMDCSEKGMTDHFRSTIIGKHIREHFHYDDAEVPLTNNIIKMAIKRNWTGKEGNINRPSLVNATEGLSPFALFDLNEDEVANMNDEDNALAAASHVTVEQIKAIKKKSEATVPERAEKFILLLKIFANFLYALFSQTCPFFRCICRIIKDIQAYSSNAKERLSMSTKSSILWVILKQSRQFAVGEMGIIAEFTEMQRCLAAKNASFNHAETPAPLYQQKKKDQNKRKEQNDQQVDTTKKQRPPTTGNNRNTWHPKLREKLGEAIKSTNYPTYTSILQYCDVKSDDLFGKYSKLCGPNAMLGRCSKGLNCTKDHSWPPEQILNKIIEVTKKFQDNPKGILQGQSS